MSDAYIIDATRTPIGRYAGSLSGVRADDLAAIPVRALIERNPGLDPSGIDEVILGCANQAGEDNRNVARMAVLLAGLPVSVPGVTVNRLCGSGMQAVGDAARAIRAGEIDVAIAGGVESMSRAPFVMPKSESAFGRNVEIYDTTLGWRFVNKLIKEQYGVDSMGETGDNVAADFQISREDQDKMALRSQQNAGKAQAAGLFKEEITPVKIPQRKGDPVVIDKDEHPRPDTTLETMARLPTLFKKGGTVTAGNAAGLNDGACALLLASEAAVKKYNLKPKARLLGMATAGVPPRIMGIGPAPATQKLLARLGFGLDAIDIIELNEAFASQGLAVLRQLGLKDDDPRVNRQGGAIALGHPLGMSGARIVATAMAQLQRGGGKRALATMCIGVGQGIASVVERV